jgi:hypothetical protein
MLSGTCPSDTVTEYAFDNSRNLLDTPDFAATVLDGVKKGPTALVRTK